MIQVASTSAKKLALAIPAILSMCVSSCDATHAPNLHSTTDTEGPSPVPVQLQDNNEPNFKDYLNNDLYRIFDIDIDLDGTTDKVVSSAPNSGDELLFFRSTSGSYVPVLISTNMTEDGGRILGDISQTSTSANDQEVVSIETFFPKGTDIATHFVSYSNNQWTLSRTVYRISDWREENEVIYFCEVAQNIPMKDLVSDEQASRIRQPPSEEDRGTECRLIY